MTTRTLFALPHLRSNGEAMTRTVLEFGVVALLLTGLPLVLPHGQILLGTVVNALLVWSALRMRHVGGLVVLALLPSLAAVAAGFWAEAASLQGLMLLLPAIWVGNMTLMLVLRGERQSGGAGMTKGLLAAAAAKTSIIAGGVLLLSAAGMVAPVVAAVMVPMQFTTALLGGGAGAAAAALAARPRNADEPAHGR